MFSSRRAGPGIGQGRQPDREVAGCSDDGAFGFAGIEFDTMARHGSAWSGDGATHGIWALEHHPMSFLRLPVAEELRPEDPL